MKCTEAVSVAAIFLDTEGWRSTPVQLFRSFTTYISKLLQGIEQSFELLMVIDPALSKPFSQCSYKQI